MRATFYPSDIYFFKRADFRQPTAPHTNYTHTLTQSVESIFGCCRTTTVLNYVHIYFVPFQTHFDGFP